MFRASATLPILLLAICASLCAAAASPQAPSTAQSPAPEITAVTPQIMQPVPPPSPGATVEQLEREADQLRSGKYYVDAIEYYKAAIAKSPLSAREKPQLAEQRVKAAQLYNKLGIAELALMRLKECRKSFDRATKLDRDFPDAYNNLGVTYYIETAQRKKTSFGKAIKYYRKAIEISEALASAHNNLATAYFGQKEYQKAFAEYTRALQLDPGILERNSRSGVAMRMSSPEDQAAYNFMIARLYAQLKDTDKCFLYLEKAVEGGYPKIHEAYKDEAFTQVRKDPRFETLMARVNSSEEK